MTREQFIAIVTEGQPAAPSYFGHDAALNRKARPLIRALPLTRMDLTAADTAVRDGAVIVDVRPTLDFAAGHVIGSIGIALDGRFAEQVGSVVGPDTPIVLAGDDDQIDEARMRLARIGFDLVIGALIDLESVLTAHPDRARQLSRLTAPALEERRTRLGERLAIVDVRTPSEVAAAPLTGARNIPLAALRRELPSLDPTQPTVVVCAGGARSAIASSVLLAAGFRDVSDVLGGANALRDTTRLQQANAT